MDGDDAIDAARGRRCAPLRVAVSGHDGAGRATLAAALRARFRLRCTVSRTDGDVPDADLLVRVIGACARRCDVEAIGRATIPVIVVAGKADVRDDPAALAEAASAVLGRPVHPVSALTAQAGLGPADLDLLASVDGPADDVGHGDLLRRLGVAGLRTARALVAAEPSITPADLGERLADLSGVDRLAAPITAVAAEVAAVRDRRHRRDLRLLAARGADRDRVERLLAAGGPG